MKTKQRLLVLNQYYAPGVEATAVLLADLSRALADEFDVTVVTATLRGSSSTTVTELRFAGLFRTAHGDRRGTPLSTFLRHWRLQGPVVTGVVRNGNLLEYNVVVGGVVFAFDGHRRLEAVGLASPSVERTLCVIPAVCVKTRIP